MRNRRSDSRPYVLLALLPLLSGGLLVACRSSSRAPVADVVWLVRHGHYADARASARELARERPGDAEVRQVVVHAEVAYLLDQGRRELFRGDPEGGLELFRQALEIDPSNPIVYDWILKTRIQLAEEALDLAAGKAASESLDEAEALFESVLTHLPAGDYGERVARIRTQARLGLSRVLLTQNYRSGQSRSYYIDGMRMFREYLLGQAEHDFSASLSYDVSNDRAAERLEDVKLALAEERLAKAQQLEAEGYPHAAGKEYRLVLLLDPENEVARNGYDRMDRHRRMAATLSDAEMEVRRGNLDDAEERLEEARQFANEGNEEIGRVVAEIGEERHRRMYEKARALERDYRYGEAVEAYRALLDEVDFYEDAIVRMETDQEFIRLAEEHYTAALDAETDEEAASYLRRIPIYWPGYRDVEDRLAEIEARLAAEAAEPEVDGAQAAGPDGR